MVGLREEWFSEKAIEFFRHRKNFRVKGDLLINNADMVIAHQLATRNSTYDTME